MLLLCLKCYIMRGPLRLGDLLFLIPTAASRLNRWICRFNIFPAIDDDVDVGVRNLS